MPCGTFHVGRNSSLPSNDCDSVSACCVRPGTAALDLATWGVFQEPLQPGHAAQLVFPALAALSGMLGGYQFVVAAQIFVPDGDGRPALGALYAIDLLGGCAGALVLSTYLIPVFGFWKTAWLGAAINLAVALPAAGASVETKRISASRRAS